jgi:hypothetical protein
MNFLEGERCAQKILGEALAAPCVVGCDGFFTAVDMKTAVFPREKFCHFLCTEKFCGAQCVEEAMAEEFGEGGQRFVGHGMEAAVFVEEAVRGEHMEMGMKDEVIAKGVDRGGSGDSAIGETEAYAEGIAQALCGGLEEEMEEVPAFAEDTTQHFWEGEDELAVGDCVADGIRDPCAGVSDPALMAGGAEVAGFASECEELFVTAIGTLKASKARGEVATSKKSADGVDGIRAEWAHGGAVFLVVVGKTIVPCVADDLPKRGGAWAAWMVDCGYETGWESRSVIRRMRPTLALCVPRRCCPTISAVIVRDSRNLSLPSKRVSGHTSGAAL